MKKISGLILIILAFASGCATYSSTKIITGKVTDYQSKPVAGAIVSTVPPSASVSTDNDGRYFIKTSTDGEYTLKINKTGYVAPIVKVYVHGVELIQGDVQIIPEEMAPASLLNPVEPKAKQETAAPAAESDAKKAKKEEPKKEKPWWER